MTTPSYQSLGQVDVYLHAKIDFIPPFFVEILSKNYKFGVLGTLGMPDYDHQKMMISVFRKLIFMQEINFTPHLILEILLRYSPCHYGYFGHAWL